MIFKIADLCFEFKQWNLFPWEWMRFEVDSAVCACKPVEIRELSVADGSSLFNIFANGEKTYTAQFDKSDSYRLNAGIYSGILPVLAEKGVIHLHAAYVLYRGNAILFTGPSGIGKTTQAELWREHMGALLVNADVTLIRKKNGRYYAYGAPVHGSDPYCENTTAPVAAVFALEKAEENVISEMAAFDAVSYLLKEIYKPELDETGQDVLLRAIDDFMRSVPVRLLRCRADMNATQVVKDFLA